MLFKFAMKFPKKKQKQFILLLQQRRWEEEERESNRYNTNRNFYTLFSPIYLLSFVHRTKTRKNGIREVREFHLIAEEFPWKFPFRGISKGNTSRASICALFEEPNKNFKAQTKEQ